MWIAVIPVDILTIKSDDITGRIQTYEAITKGQDIPEPGVPESFRVLINELQGLAIDVKLFDDDGNEVSLNASSAKPGQKYVEDDNAKIDIIQDAEIVDDGKADAEVSDSPLENDLDPDAVAQALEGTTYAGDDTEDVQSELDQEEDETKELEGELLECQ